MFLRKNQGYLITIENIDGFYNENYVLNFYNFLKDLGYKVELIRADENICNTDRIDRALYLSQDLEDKTELLLAFAKLNEINRNKIIPLLKEGYIVIYEKHLDFIHSKYAVANIAFKEGLDRNQIHKLLSKTANNIHFSNFLAGALDIQKPHKTIFFDTSIENIIKKLNIHYKDNDFDRKEENYLNIFKTIYAEIIKKEKNRFISINVDKINHLEDFDKIIQKEFSFDYV